MILFLIYIIVLGTIIFACRTVLAQLWFFFIGIYTSVTYAVYEFRPDLFHLIKVSVAGDKSFELGSFLILSIISNYLFYLFFSNTRFLYRLPVLRLDTTPKPMLILFCYCLLELYLCTYFLINTDKFNWGTGSNSLGTPLFALLFRLFIAMTILIAGYIVIPSRISKLPFVGAALLGVILILAISLKSSSRSDILYLFLGLFVLGVSTLEISKVKLLGGAAVGSIFALMIGQIVLLQRGSIDGNIFELFGMVFQQIGYLDEGTLTMFVSQDYFAPAVTLVMSIEKEIVIPVAAIKSNFANFFYLIHEKTISELIVEQYDFTFLRGAGFSFLIYTEGYNMLGYMGFLYNGVACGFLLHMLNPNFNGVSKQCKNVLVSILAVLFLQVIRGQTGVALKVIYTLLPIYFSYCVLFGYSLWFKRP